MYSQIGRTGKTRRGPVANRQRKACRLPLAPQEEAVISVLQRRSKGVYLLGGGVAAKAAGTDFPYLNLLVESSAFNKTKNDLFEFGVTPVSTPELPGHFIRFVHAGKSYSALNLELEPFVKQNVLGQQLNLLPLAHNFLVYSVNDAWVLDPYGALESKAGRQDRYRIKVVETPRTPLAGLEVCLAVVFDSSLLGLESPRGHAAFERRVLGSKVQDEKEATQVFHQVVSYFPDLMEARGWEVTRKYLVSPLCLSAAAAGPGIDLRKADAALAGLVRRGQDISSAHLVSAINAQFTQPGAMPGVGSGLADYMASRKLSMRRKDLLAEVIEGKRPVDMG